MGKADETTGIARPAVATGDGDVSARAEILAEVSGEALQGDDLEAVLQAIVGCLHRRLPVAIASIILLDETGSHFVQEVWAGSVDLDLPAGLPWPVEIGAAGRCARSGIAQHVPDVGADADYVAGNGAVCCEYLVPIRHRGRLHGVLNLESTRADFFCASLRAMFDAIALQIAGAIHLARIVRELECANRALRELSMRDGLTGVANRRSLDARLAEAWARAAAHADAVALLLVDVDRFKALNDACGHLRGDECLRELAGLCVAALGTTPGLVARYGGEEFAVLLPGADLRAGKRCAERLRRRVAARAIPHPASSVAAHVTVSIGVGAAFADAAIHPESLIAAADAALYAAKEAGRDRVVAQPVGSVRARRPPRT